MVPERSFAGQSRALVAAGVVGFWLILTRLLHSVVLDHFGIWAMTAFVLSGPVVFGLACLWAAAYWDWKLGDHAWSLYVYRLDAIPSKLHGGLPLAVLGAALAIYLLVPFSRLVNHLDFWLHHAARTEIVRRIEMDGLAPAPPTRTIIPLSHKYPPSVSNHGESQWVGVYQADGALHVEFWQRPALLDRQSVLVYRADDRPPAGTLTTPGGFEKLTDGWYRVER